jgi:P-type E1-E2 ATPase
MMGQILGGSAKSFILKGLAPKRHGGLAFRHEIDLNSVAPSDRPLVRQGDVAPVDGTLADGLAVLDLSVLTGESIPIQRSRRKHLERRLKRRRSVRPVGNASGRLQHLCRHHQAGRSGAALKPADIEARRPVCLAFLATTLALSLGASFFSGDPICAVAVLVIATPCPSSLRCRSPSLPACRGPQNTASQGRGRPGDNGERPFDRHR